MSQSQMGKFVVVEGLEGAGKSSAIACIKASIEAKGFSVVCTREPGGTPMSEAIRNCVKQDWHDEKVTVEAELLLMYAARAQLVANVIKPALDEGNWVIGDRHDLSSQAYQGGGRGVAKDTLNSLRDITLQGFEPDFTLYMDVEPEIGLQRAKGRGELDRIEQEALSFFTRTRDRYLQLTQHKNNVKLINTMQAMPDVHQDVTDAISQYLESI